MLRAVFVLGILAGCDVGEVPVGGGGTDAGNDPGAATFQSMVAPLVTECVVNGCHTVQNPILTDYASVLPKYKMKPGMTNILVTKATEAAPHNGTSLTAAEQTTIAGWIDSLP